MTGLDERQRSVLERIVVSSRITFEDDLGSILTGTYGISADGTIEDEERLADDSPLRTRRRVLVEVLDYFRREGASTQQAVARLIREAAFTHTNRLIAIRVADELDVLPPSLRHGPRSAGFKQLLELAPLLATSDDTGGYWTYLQFCADELARDVPALFDPRNPLLALRPSKLAIDSVVDRLSDDEHAEIWSADDTFGWAYQFFNTGDERRVMREASAAPRDSRELAVRNQFFTPRYVVDFLTQNTLGRRLLDADPSSKLLEQLPLLVDPPTEQGEPVELEDVRVLDPACGSGHFLLGCYEILERAWQLEGVSPREAAPRIVPCIWGIDIDPRAVQVAQAAIVFRARKVCGRDPLQRPNIVTARALPDDDSIWETATADLSADRRQLVAAMRAALRDAPILGPLLKVENHLRREIHSAVGAASPLADDLFAAAGLARDAFGAAERDVLVTLQRAADLTESTVADRLLAADAGDAIRFIEAVRSRYDCVLMNPPFGLAIPETEAYLKAHYKIGWTELYACFALRGLELLADRGYLGSITSSQYFTTRKMKSFRERLIASHRPIVIIELGAGVLHGAAVNTSCQILPANRSTGTCAYLDLTAVDVDEKAAVLHSTGNQLKATDLQTFLGIDGHPFAFHVDSDRLVAWEATHRFEPSVGIVRTGGNTFDNFRFLRCRWEVRPHRIGEDWVPYQKGGDYRPYWSSHHLVVQWKDDGRDLRALGKAKGVLPQVMQSSTLWRRPGLCYPRANKALGVRLMPAGEIFAEKSIAIFVNDEVPILATLGLLNSTPVAMLLETFGRGRFIENSAIKRLPVSAADLVAAQSEIEGSVLELVEIFAIQESFDEQSPFFAGFTISSEEWQALNDRWASRAFTLQELVDSASRGIVELPDQGEITVEDRRSLVETTLREGGDSATWARRFLSFAVGLAFGRWSPDPHPTRLVHRPDDIDEPLPSQPLAAGPNYWPDGRHQSVSILVDDATSDLDLASRVEAVAEALPNGSEHLSKALSLERADSVRAFLRQRFFKQHLDAYSRSRRQAPLYWQLMVPSGLWSVWVYAPALSRELLFEMVRELDRRISVGADRIRAVTEGRDSQARSDRHRAKQLATERDLVQQLTELRNDVARVAATGWEPDLDDGFVLNAAPLSSWLPKNTWKQAAQALDQIRAGEYEWSSIHRHREQL